MNIYNYLYKKNNKNIIKKMKLFIFLFLTLFLTINNDYSIDSFLDYLQEKGYWEIILNVKITFGNDVAIDICTALTESPHDCEKVVRIYMTNPPSNKCPAHPFEKMKAIIKRNLVPDRIINLIINKHCTK